MAAKYRSGSSLDTKLPPRSRISLYVFAFLNDFSTVRPIAMGAGSYPRLSRIAWICSINQIPLFRLFLKSKSVRTMSYPKAELRIRMSASSGDSAVSTLIPLRYFSRSRLEACIRNSASSSTTRIVPIENSPPLSFQERRFQLIHERGRIQEDCANIPSDSQLGALSSVSRRNLSDKIKRLYITSPGCRRKGSNMFLMSSQQ